MEESASSASLASMDTARANSIINNDSLTAGPAPILQGHVFKQSSHGIGSKMGMLSFKKRYFVLYDGVIMYYEHESSYRRDSHLKHGKKLLLDDLYLTHSQPHSSVHCFTLHLPHKANKRRSYVLAMSNRKSRNIWIEMLQQQNPQLEPPRSETDGHPKPLPPYINMIRTLRTPSPILKQRPIAPGQIHITELENYHYSFVHGNKELDHELQCRSLSHHRPSGLLHTQRKGSLHSLTDSL